MPVADSEDFFGSGVALSGDIAVVGAIGEESDATGINGNQANNQAANSGAADTTRKFASKNSSFFFISNPNQEPWEYHQWACSSAS